MADMELQGDIAPPMANGEIVFEAPWQSRTFGMARALCEAGIFSWDSFRQALIAQIGDDTGEGEYRYFDHFLSALVQVLEQRQICDPSELEILTHELAARPHGHDH